MKKTISITVGGVLFLIEEDGYDKLSQYLNQVHQYFITYRDSREIIADIESRVAELFISRHQNKQESITLDDVEFVIATLGSVSDFAEAYDDEDLGNASQTGFNTNSSAGSKQHQFQSSHAGRLRRNLSDKMIAGICSGLAAYLKVQTVWVRIAFVCFFFGFFWLPAIPGITLLSYLALWISMPAEALGTDNTVKKLFRSRKDKVLGGVCSGLAQFFSVDVSVVRLLALVSIFFFGTGIVVYIVIWLATPEANSLTDEMKMAGQPINLASIEDAVKKQLEPQPSENESVISKIILFPFRIVSILLKGLAPIARAILRGFALLFGISISMSALAALLGLFVAGMAIIGIIPWTSIIHVDEFPLVPFMVGITKGLLIAGLVVALVPVIFFLVLGFKLLYPALRIPIILFVSLGALWMLSLAFGTVEGLRFLNKFSAEGEVRKTVQFAKPKVVNIQPGLSDRNAEWAAIRLFIDSWDGDSIKIERIYTSQGTNELNAEANARLIKHTISLEDTNLILDARYTLDPDVQYRGQDLTVKIYLPYGTKFRLSKYFTTNTENIHFRSGNNSRRFYNGIFLMQKGELNFLDTKSDESFSGIAKRNEDGYYDFEDRRDVLEDELTSPDSEDADTDTVTTPSAQELKAERLRQKQQRIEDSLQAVLNRAHAIVDSQINVRSRLEGKKSLLKRQQGNEKKRP